MIAKIARNECGCCKWFRICRNQSCFITPDQSKCKFPYDNGTSRWTPTKLRGKERNKVKRT